MDITLDRQTLYSLLHECKLDYMASPQTRVKEVLLMASCSRQWAPTDMKGPLRGKLLGTYYHSEAGKNCRIWPRPQSTLQSKPAIVRSNVQHVAYFH